MVLNNIMNFTGKIFQPMQTQAIAPATTQNQNPFANPFLASKEEEKSNYGKNKPMMGGYFAGYYNGKPNIVGTRLFLEV